MKRREQKFWTWRVLKLAAMVLLFLGLADGGLRILGLGNPVLYVHDADCGYLPAPNQNVHRFFRLNHINAYSMRSEDFARQKPGETFRVLFVGDSVTYGTTFVDQADIFTSILQRDLPGSLHRPVEVLNASAGGWAPGNEAGFLQSRGTYGANLVVFVLNTGDLNQPFNQQALTLASGYPDHEPPLAIWEAWVRYAWPRIARLQTADAGSIPLGGQGETIGSAMVLESLGSARRDCSAAHARFAIVYVPSRGPGWGDSAHRAWLGDLSVWAWGLHVPLLDASGPLGALPVGTAYFDGVHLRPAGDALLARAIEDHWSELSGGAQP